MAFCAQCGSETQGSSCAACGVPGKAPVASATSGTVLEEHVVSALCYLLWPLTGVLFLVVEPYSRYKSVRFHAFQSIFVFLALFGGFGALSILAFLPFVSLFFSLVTLIYPLFAFALWALLMFKAYNKEQFVVPVLGPLAQSQA
jgi:uncharacterized membrane protein